MSFVLYSNGKQVTDKASLKLFAGPEEIGVFESLRTYRGKIFRKEEHIQRFLESARTVGVREKIDSKQIARELDSALKAVSTSKEDGDFFLRITWWKAGVFVMAGRRKHSEELYRRGAALKTSPVKRSPSHAVPSGAKTTDYVNAALATLEPKPDSVYEWLFLDAAGFVTEVRIGNFFIIKDGKLLTPPTTGILNGVTRRFVIECAHELGIPVLEVPLTRHEVYNADEAFLTNTSWEILPVRELDQRKIGQKIPGPLTHKLQNYFKQKALQECR